MIQGIILHWISKEKYEAAKTRCRSADVKKIRACVREGIIMNNHHFLVSGTHFFLFRYHIPAFLNSYHVL